MARGYCLIKGAYWFDMGWFQEAICVGFIPNEKAWHRELKDHGVTDEYPKDYGRVTTYESNETNHRVTCLITLADIVDTFTAPQIMGLIAHECLHVVEKLRAKIGETNLQITEYDTYALQILTTRVGEAYCEARKIKVLGWNG